LAACCAGVLLTEGVSRPKWIFDRWREARP
jgi:hypothetical protein